MRLLALSLATVLGVLAPAVSAAGPSITLNGVNIDGVAGQRFEKCTVVIDAQGNVHIEAEGWAVAADAATRPPRPPPATPPPTPPTTTTTPVRPPVATAEPRPASGRVTRRYFLVCDETEPGGTQYAVKVFINAKWIDAKLDGGPVRLEVTKYLHPGANKVLIAAEKQVIGQRKHYTKDVKLELMIGEGDVSGDQMMIEKPLVEMSLTAEDFDPRTEEYVIQAR